MNDNVLFPLQRMIIGPNSWNNCRIKITSDIPGKHLKKIMKCYFKNWQTSGIDFNGPVLVM